MDKAAVVADVEGDSGGIIDKPTATKDSNAEPLDTIDSDSAGIAAKPAVTGANKTEPLLDGGNHIKADSAGDDSGGIAEKPTTAKESNTEPLKTIDDDVSVIADKPTSATVHGSEPLLDAKTELNKDQADGNSSSAVEMPTTTKDSNAEPLPDLANAPTEVF